MIEPRWGIGFFLIALLPWGIRIISGEFPFQRTSLDWFILIFLVTAWIGYWTAYDKATAWNKVWLVMTAILIYYALVIQPEENLFLISILLFCIGVSISFYYFLTYDFVAAPRKFEFANRIGRWIMEIRPQSGWNLLHPNYVSGLTAITTPFILYPTWMLRKNINERRIPFYLIVFTGLAINFFAILMATSRGAVMAIASGLGMWLLWRIVKLNGNKTWVKNEALFPFLVIFYLCLNVVIIYIGPAHAESIPSVNYYFGNGSRAELFSRSLYLLQDYLITGGGLGSFPGLYSRYLLDIPYFNVPNSHNLFLDVAIEQGIFGGVSFILMYLTSIWFVARSLTKELAPDAKLFRWILLVSLVIAFIHGMVDDYLYNGNGTVLAIFLVGLSVPVTQQKHPESSRKRQFVYNQIIGLGLLALAVLFIFYPAKVLSTWYANLGAVQLSKVELDGFPDKGWTGSAIASRLGTASKTLQTSLQFDPDNRTANERLGIILMLGGDFESAFRYLETAYKLAPYHRGTIKLLGYCYVWLGEMEKAASLLAQIPEAHEELDTYIWWWGTQGRSDLSGNASLALLTLEPGTNKP